MQTRKSRESKRYLHKALELAKMLVASSISVCRIQLVKIMLTLQMNLLIKKLCRYKNCAYIISSMKFRCIRGFLFVHLVRRYETATRERQDKSSVDLMTS